MAKRSKRRPSRHERDPAGCISGLINVFSFRQGRSTKRLLTDRKEVSKQAECAGHLSNNIVSPSSTVECETSVDTEKSKMPKADASKTSVKELMEEEMCNEQSPEQPNDSNFCSEQIKSKSGNHMKKSQKKTKSSAKSCDMDLDQDRHQKPLCNFNLERILQELADIDQKKTNILNYDVDIDIPSSEAMTVVEEKLVQAVKLFIEQRLSNSKRFGDEENSFRSLELTDALKTLSSNKGLFLKLLEDPNSELVKHIQNFDDAHLLCKKDQAARCSPVNPKPVELSSHKNRSFFRRRTKSLESFPQGVDNNNKDSQSSNKIIILKPGPTMPGSPVTDIADNERNTNVSQFSFMEIKRKIRHAMGKERRGISPERLSPKSSNSNNGEKRESFGWKSPNRNHFYTERFTLSSLSFNKGVPAGKLKDEGSESLRLGGSNIYIEAKKHLSEMVMSGDENTESVSGNNSVKPLGRILSFPEYNVSPCLSPKKHRDEIFLAAQMRLSPHGMVKKDQSLTEKNSGSQPRVSCSNSGNKEQTMLANVDNSIGDDREYSFEIRCFNDDTVVSEVQLEKAIDMSCQPSRNSIGGDNQNGDTREVDDAESGSLCFKSHLSVDDQVLSPPDRATTEIEDLNRTIEKIEQPSPVSVLEPLFTDGDISPASTISHPVEKENQVEPRHIIFEEEQCSDHDQGICTRISPEGEESAFEYVEAVLLGSGLNWDEFLLRWLSSYEILDSSLFDEVELFSSRSHHDQKLLFHCANEALEEVCKDYFGCFSGTSSTKTYVRPVPKGMDLIHDVWERVEKRLLQNSQSLPLDGLLKKDLVGSTKWINLHSDIELIVQEVEEIIFYELVDEIFLGCFQDCAFECEFDVCYSEFKNIEDVDS
ncbi:Unknown protein [Striga hermonthica]|uniref:DUF4378 domain-containing protein n=1 Tax=Striga hermonthica TaxID=68872 RepID=A0A9N7N3I1_STRHE|nr:Unknown protein [Striga hermonthica]